MIGGGFGSAITDFFKLNNHDRRVALAVGIGGGVGSIFKAPPGGAILSTEILYRRDFEFEALLPSFISSIVGYSIFASWHGWNPIFSINTDVAFTRPQELFGYALLGIACGFFGILYGRFFYHIRDLFKSLKIPNYVKPAIGGFVVGNIAIFLPQIMGMGYGWIQLAIDGNFSILPLGLIIGVILGKIVATSFSIGSGGSGGVFAPGLMIGSMVGGALWLVLHKISTIVPSSPPAFVVVGMMALFGGIAKAPLAIMIMVSEMTGSYSLLIPSMVSVVIAYFLTGSSYMYENQVDTRAHSPAHAAEYAVPLLQKVHVKDVMVTSVKTASPNMNIDEVSYLMKSNKIDALPVIDSGDLSGLVANLDIA